MEVLIISGIAIGFFLLILLLGKKNKLRADRFLVIYLSFFIFNHGYSYLELSGALDASPWMILGKGFYLLGAPLFFYYIYALTREKPLNLKVYGFTLLPFLLYAITFFYYYLKGFDETIQVRSGLLYINNELSAIWTGFVILFHLSDPFYIAWFYFLLREYKEKINTSLSFTDHIHLNWLNVLFYVWIFSAVILFPFSILSIGLRWIPITLLQALLQLSNVIFIFIAGYYGFRQTSVFSDLVVIPERNKEINSSAYQRSGLTKEQATEYHARLLALMSQKKPYLNGELSAHDLAKELTISINHLSQVLNQEQKQNFFDFVNSYRVKEVQEKMTTSQFDNYTLLAIALESGFNSKTSFNTIFKKFTHQTPSRYYQMVKAGKSI